MQQLIKISSKKSDYFWKLQNVSSNVRNAQYSVRGTIPTRALNIENQLKIHPTKYPFNKVTFCNIGNPQAFGQPPISFHRQVLSALLYPKLLQTNVFNQDVKKRASSYLKQIVSVGSYTQSIGIKIVREGVANFLERQDKIQRPDPNNIFLTEGASQGVHLIFSSILCNPNDSIMIPIPQYPLYSATLSLYNGQIVPYYLDQESGWQITIEQIEKAYQTAVKEKKVIKGIVIINPGNPTGSVFNIQTIKNIIEFAVKKKLIIIADQVYRNNVYIQSLKFHSVRSVLETTPFKYQAQVISLNSASKGLLGQCGIRAGYMQLYNIDPNVRTQLVKLKSIQLCSNAVGQCLVDLMVNPPIQNVLPQTKQLYLTQIANIYKSLKNRAQIVQFALEKMDNIKTQQVSGAMYAFPSIYFMEGAIKQAEKQGLKPDVKYCLDQLNETGIAIVPGSGFLQKPGTYHFRIATLILPDQQLHKKMQILKKFNNEFHKRY